MRVVSSCGKAYSPCVVYPGKQPQYLKVQGRYDTLEDVLMPFNLFHNETSADNSDIIYNWGLQFLKITEDIRVGGQHLVLVLDGYGGHIQYPFLKLMKDNRFVVIALPAHTLHVIQPL